MIHIYTHSHCTQCLSLNFTFPPNRVYKPCLGVGDHSLPYSLESETLGNAPLKR